MKSLFKQKLESLFQFGFSSVRFDEPLSSHCTFRIGGPADAFIEISSLDAKGIKNFTALLKFLKSNGVPYFIIGSGSNILFHDKGFRGAVIKITSNEIKFSANKLEADAGVNLQFLISEATKNGFQNLAQFAGIPGTLGGAVRGNAGANGIEIEDVLISAKILNTKTGTIKTLTNTQLKFKYRNSHIKKTPNLIVLSAKLRLSRKSKFDKSLIQKRAQTQPWGLSAGSFFKNPTPKTSAQKAHSHLTPEKFKAGFLIDQCGLKGARFGGAGISDLHANFIINLADTHHPATQKDVLALAAKAKQAVYAKFKIRLEEEVEIVPEKPTLPKTLRKSRKQSAL